ncbi:hypothetical protein CcCBS67573_g06297 [Chytriomyces confervae]|uniref:NADH dehydrogenase [ubiquinone] 1 beta subcomplex subunit 10 n=1 Tax=Chytriomyces confervae TaxID=246404 RepID=A0A507F780_9FUNG|nr:hypothetical protein CcCBS67573_g06297 [Chytriomyces confervae]
MTVPEPIKISPFPVVDPSLDKSGDSKLGLRFPYTDHISFVKARSAYVKEQLVRTEEINYVREKMKWCYRREGVNHLQNCRHLTMQYMELARAAKLEWIKPFKMPAASTAASDEE